MTALNPNEKCRTCIHAYKHLDTVRLQALGFRNCRHLPTNHMVRGINVCRIGKYEEKKS